MAYRDKIPWKLLERWSAAAFIAAGVLFLVTSALFGSATLTDISHPGWVTGLFGLSGLIASFIGLVGLYPQLVDRAPRIARAGVMTLVIAGIALVVFPLCQFAKTWGIDLQSLPIVVFLIAVIATISGFLLFGIASLRTRVPSRKVGFLIIGTSITFIVLLVLDMIYGGSPVWVDFIMSMIQSFLLLTLGYAMPTNTIPFESKESEIAAISG